MLTLTPNNITSFPGSRQVFRVLEDGFILPLSSLQGSSVQVYYPGEHPYLATIHETDNSFSWVVPPGQGTNQVRVLVSWDDTAEYASFTITINPVLAARFTYRTSPDLRGTGVVHADIYNPVGQLVHSAPMTDTGYGYELTDTPRADWYEGEYRIAVRDDTGVLDVDSLWIDRPSLASMKEFFNLPPWQRQLLEYLKYEMMGDTEPLHPGALFTLEEYSKHWKMTVGEVNAIMPTTRFSPGEIPLFWGDVMLKGTILRVYHALANRAVTIPRWQNLTAPIQDESHYQQSYEQRYNILRPEYVEERAYIKGAHLPGPSVTVDPFLGYIGGNLAGQTGLAMIGRPSWFAGVGGGLR